jgi:hypothetical protein
MVRGPQDKNHNLFMSGNFVGYVSGAWDAMDDCAPEEVELYQMVRIVYDYLQDHPEKLHYKKGSIIVEHAINEAFPCDKVE